MMHEIGKLLNDSWFLRVDADDVEGSCYRAVVFVQDEAIWFSFMNEFLALAAEDEDYGAEPQKGFFWDERTGSLSFVWTLFIWGDLSSAHADVAAAVHLQEQWKPQPPARRTRTKRRQPRENTADPEPVKARNSNVLSVEEIGPGVRKVKVRLPHVRKQRNMTDINESFGLEDLHYQGRRRLRASAAGYTGGRRHGQ